MIREDYILRLIERCAEIVARILALGREDNKEEALAEVDRLTQTLAGLDLEPLLEMDESAIQARFVEQEFPVALREKSVMLATAFYQAGCIRQSQGESDAAFACHLKGLNLLLGVANLGDDTQLADFVPTIDQLYAIVRDYELPMPTLLGLMQYHERFGAFDRAEDLLGLILDREPDNREWLEWASLFYRRLLNKTDEELVQGGLARQEIETSLCELAKRSTQAGRLHP